MKDFHTVPYILKLKKKKAEYIIIHLPYILFKEDMSGVKFPSICQQEREKWGCTLNGTDPISLSFILFAVESHMKHGFESI